jgi:hypothetical protein
VDSEHDQSTLLNNRCENLPTDDDPSSQPVPPPAAGQQPTLSQAVTAHPVPFAQKHCVHVDMNVMVP